MPILRRSAGDISYQVTGEGQPLLLSHGYGATSAMFGQNLPALSAHHRVVTWDLRGHGASASPPDPACYTAENALADMAAILDELGPDRAVLGGHSLGGYLSLAFTLAHPDRVAGLVLIGTGPGFRNDEAREAWNRRAEATAARLAGDGVAALGGSAELLAGGHADVNGLILAAQGTLTQRDAHVINGLPSISVPALVIVGANDAHFLAAADYMAAKMPAARKVVIENAGHAPNIDQPDKFAGAVSPFLAGIASDTAAPSTGAG
jgi:pimeloyl-ACP methyl ester carboxylesterase